MAKTCAIILAGGKGTRMKTDLPKAMCEVLFKPMVGWVIDVVREAGVEDLCVVTGHLHEVVEAYLPRDCEVAFQAERLGTGHAVMMARDFLKKHPGEDVVIVNGDNPMMTAETIQSAYQYHKENDNSITLVSAMVEDTNGIGHIKRDAQGNLERIIEHKDANEEEKKINESNAGTYWFKTDRLLEALDQITCENAQNEYYLTDTLAILIAAGDHAGAYVVPDPTVVLGANDRVQLAGLTELMRAKIIRKLQMAGADIPCSDGVLIGPDVEVGHDTCILPGCVLMGKTKIGNGCLIGPNTQIWDSCIGDGAKLDNAKCESCQVADEADIGPFVHIRPNSSIGTGVHLGNFVEVKNSAVDEGTKVSHLTYVGDSDVGKNVNFGCGCVTVNYNGKEKNRTVIKDGAFIGCNTNLIAPVTIGEKAYTAAGSTITEDVPDVSLGIARARQVNKNNWVDEKKPYKEK